VVEPQQEPGQVGELVELLRHGAGLKRGGRLQDVGELVVELGQVRRLERAR
jgi:hypothetical protein